MAYRLLIADDHAIVRAVLRLNAEAHPEMTVCADEAATGQQAIDLAIQYSPDAVILDNEMPEMKGVDALPALRRALPDRVIVVYSSVHSDVLTDNALRAGADACFQKGVQTPAEVVDYVVDRLTSGSGTAT